jgi:hypothetical protein
LTRAKRKLHAYLSIHTIEIAQTTRNEVGRVNFFKKKGREKMTTLTRRGLLKQSSVGAVVGILAATAAADAPSIMETTVASSSSVTSEVSGMANTLDTPLVAYISNPMADEISVMVGTKEIIIHNSEFVGQLLRMVGH